MWGKQFKCAQHLNVEKLSLLPNSPDSSKIFALWKRKFDIYTKTLGANDSEKFDLLINRLDFTPYEYVDKTTSYKEAMDNLESIYDKKINKIYARWKLANEKQLEDESMDAFVLRLMVLAKDCDFKDVTAVEHKNESVLQSFVSGLEDNYIRQRILENDVVTLEDALKCADILKRAKVNAGKYESSETFKSTVATIGKEKAIPDTTVKDKDEIDHVATVSKPFKSKINRFSKCHNCGDIHAPLRCPAYGKTCFKCGNLNHWSKYCRRTKQMLINLVLATLNENGRKLCSANVLAPSVIDIEIIGNQKHSLLYTGDTE